MESGLKKHKRIVFTGGGTAGHVTPNIALIEPLLNEGWEVHYIGSETGMEKDLIAALEGVAYHGIATGKLRRYFSWQNFIDPFRVIKGYFQARRLIRRIRPDVIFSKGGFVSVPVVLGAGKVPVVAHESDFSPGLSNRIACRFTDRVCVSFEDTLPHVPHGKGVFTGTPIRPALYEGSRERALRFTGLSGEKPVLLVMGGSLGAQKLNELVRAALPKLNESFDVIHLCGRGKDDCDCVACGYQQYEYIDKELPDLFALSDIVLSRAGANSVFELLALNKPSVLVPLTSASTRGDQLLNAEYFEKKGYAEVIDQNTATPESLAAAVERVYAERERYAAAMCKDTRSDGTDAILAIIREAAARA
ncbi:MAG: undecaprenyldiphospho-muramoylpentapeptide beta-N-acetylglucosaminyltransferase [Clostridiales bacterium]|nr:undecaprenyldiphospho-muramoylpentapeptide beta-N-acetylglucosaminyltransferase [Clostridiales bacterium]